MEAISITEEDRILEILNSEGLVKFKNILSEVEFNTMKDDVLRLLSPATQDARNCILPSESANFIGHTMFVKNAIKAYTNKNVLNIGEQFCNSKVHLANHRIYQNIATKKEPQHWHKDNKVDFMKDGKLITDMVSDDKGLIMIYYLEDVNEGGTEFIMGSQDKLNTKESFSDSEVRKLGSVISMNGSKAGEGVLYDYRMIHRAGPTYKSGHSRLSLFSQMSSNKMPAGEPIALRTSDLGHLSEQAEAFLNYGVQSTSANWPLIRVGKKSIFKRIIQKVKRSFKS